jgi:Predicted symporter
MGLNTLAIVLVVILISMTIALSVFSRRFTRTTADFYLAGRKVGSFANASAISGDYLSAASFLGVAAAVYASGLDGVWYAAGFAGGFIVVVLFIASPLRRFGEYTVPDFAFGRFNTNRMRLVSVVGVLATSLFYMAPQMYGAGTTWKVLVGRGIFGLDAYQSGVVVVAVIIMIYVAVGGMKGTTLNQIIQFWWLAFAMILVVIFATFVGFDVNGDGSMRIRFNYPETLASQSEEPLRDVKTFTVADLTANDGALLAEAEAAMRPEAFAEVKEAVETGAPTDSVTVAVFAKNKLHALKNELLGTEDGVFFNKPGAPLQRLRPVLHGARARARHGGSSAHPEPVLHEPVRVRRAALDVLGARLHRRLLHTCADGGPCGSRVHQGGDRSGDGTADGGLRQRPPGEVRRPYADHRPDAGRRDPHGNRGSRRVRRDVLHACGIVDSLCLCGRP